jgi:hypothetical protein
MKCPHCEYEHGWSNEKREDVKGEHDGFYVLPVELEQRTSWDTNRVGLYACPACRKTFVE